ncbi:unnamed protein product [Bursaphelenchus xylophilus]|uniref:(pine wood nematode) hypothetical protein n=1 Tax=Bursaphelenchus xylophilus TaxID=6326 RepID=A0A1I7RLV3_BURXY|nr:unnamed protein product [Bursaphelenchus xylophilus]CAG9106206.1 unnamed protein product [Bursaphelenchus xylophilus]
MDLMIRRHEFFEAHWNCSQYNASAIPESERRHPFYGLFLFSVSVVYMVLYVPCLYAMTRKELYANPCYKIMVQMACYDCITIPITGLLSGFLSFYGVMYCDARLMNNIVGTVLLGVWMAYSWAAVILALNRIASLTDKEHWFRKNRVYFWLSIPLLVGLVSSIFGTPVAYSPILGSWTFNPFIESVVDVNNLYSMPIHTADNLSFSIILPTIYLVFFLKNRALLRNKSNSVTSKKDFSLFIQCCIISACITVAATGYTFIQFLPLPLWIAKVSHILWLLVQGSPPIVYLLINRSIQRILLKKIRIRVKSTMASNSGGGNSFGNVVHTVPSNTFN